MNRMDAKAVLTAIENGTIDDALADTEVDNFPSFGPFTMDASAGLTKEVTRTKGNNTLVEEVWVCAPVEVLGKSRAPDGKGWGKQLRFKDGDGRPHLMQVLDAELQGEPSTLCAKLADSGLNINRERQRELVYYLSSVSVEARVTVVNHTGWHEVGGRKVFVMPDVAIGADDGEAVALDAAAHGPYKSSGSIIDWKQGVGMLTKGHALPVLAVSMAFAGPLAHLIRADGGGVHFVGQSSIGKSSLLAAAASVWGRGETRNSGYIRSWRATDNGLEGSAALTTDTCLILDEMGEGAAQAVAASIYSLANGVGKQRANTRGSLRTPHSWRVSIISSGEVGVAAKIAEDRGKAVKAGQAIRLLDIPADAGKGHGCFDSAGGFNHARELADETKAAACRSYGSAGPEFVSKIIDAGTDQIAVVAKDRMAKFVAQVAGQNCGEQIGRAAKVFALIAFAGELATGFGITPWEKGEARLAAAWAFSRWIEQRGGGGSHEARQAIQQVRRMIEQHGDSRFDPADGRAAVDRPVTNRLGWRKIDDKRCEWWVPPEVWKTEFCAGLNPVSVARTLAEHGMLRRQDDKNLMCVVTINGEGKRCYVLTSKILDGD